MTDVDNLDADIKNAVNNNGSVYVQLRWEDGTIRNRHIFRRNYIVTELGMTKTATIDGKGYCLWYCHEGEKVYIHWQFPAGVTFDFLTLVTGGLEYPVVINVELHIDVKYEDRDKAKLPYYGGLPFRENQKQAIFIKKGTLKELTNLTPEDRYQSEVRELNDVTMRPEPLPEVFSAVVPIAIHMVCKTKACSTYYIKRLELECCPNLTFRQYLSNTFSKIIKDKPLQGRVLIQGITPPDDAPMNDIYHLLQHTDELLHITLLWEG